MNAHQLQPQDHSYPDFPFDPRDSFRQLQQAATHPSRYRTSLHFNVHMHRPLGLRSAELLPIVRSP